MSVLGHNYAIMVGGELTLVSGTSASAPTFAGMITLANECRLAKAKAPLGFLNKPYMNWIHSGDSKGKFMHSFKGLQNRALKPLLAGIP